MYDEALRLTADDLLAGASATYDLPIPRSVLTPGAVSDDDGPAAVVQIQPITIGAFQLIMKAARGDPGLVPLLMVKEALVQPAMSLDQVRRMHLGLVQYLVEQIRLVSGLAEKKSPPAT